MENLNIADDISGQAFSLVDYANIFESFAIGIAALGAAYFGAKSIKNLLQEEDIKERYKIVRQRNFELTSYSLDLLRKVDQNDTNPSSALSESELVYFRELSQYLEKESHGSGSVPQTFCYLLKNIIDSLKPGYKSDRGSYILRSGRLEAFFYNTVARMIYYLDHHIEVPTRKRTNLRNLIVGWWYGLPAKRELAPGSFGVFLSNRSFAVKAMHDVLEEINAESIYYALLFKHVRNTREAVRKSLEFNAYIPPSFEARQSKEGVKDIFFYGTQLFLIKTEINTDIDTDEKTVRAYYHDLDRSSVDLKQGDALAMILHDMRDNISGMSFFDLFKKYMIIGDGAIRVEIPISKMNRKQKKFKKQVQKKAGPKYLPR